MRVGESENCRGSVAVSCSFRKSVAEAGYKSGIHKNWKIAATKQRQQIRDSNYSHKTTGRLINADLDGCGSKRSSFWKMLRGTEENHSEYQLELSVP